MLYYKLCLQVVLAESLWTAAFLFLEEAVEVGYVVEPAFVAYLRYGHSGVNELSGRMAYTDVGDIFRERGPCSGLEETAEGRRRHPCKLGEVFEVYLPGIVAVYGFFHFADSARVVRQLRVGERRACQRVAFGCRGEMV